jgi:putative transport protein
VGTGTLAGNDIDSLLTKAGLYACLLGGIVSIVMLVSAHYISKLVKFDSFESIGIVCGTLNASSALPQSGSRYLREVSSIFYASIYPVALIIKIIIVQALLVLR